MSEHSVVVLVVGLDGTPYHKMFLFIRMHNHKSERNPIILCIGVTKVC